LLDIVGARFHCAICDSVDICSNCESAGLPGNLDSSDDSHNSSHIMIKVYRPARLWGTLLTSQQIPYPLETTELQTASRRAANLWSDRDAPNVLGGPLSSKSKPSSVYSSYARTVIGTGNRNLMEEEREDDHHKCCNACNTVRLKTIPSMLTILTCSNAAYFRSPVSVWLMFFFAIVL
jgi:hypothetical protein